MKKHFWKIIFVGVVVLMVGSVVYANYASKQADAGVVITDHMTGNQESSVTLVEYGDFQCPACAQFHPIIQGVLDQYGDQLAFEFKNFPLVTIHPFALPAAKAAEAAGQQGKYFEMYDKLYENQKAWSSSATPQAFFVQYAEELELDIDLFKQHMRSKAIDSHVKAQYEEAQKLGLTGTPAFYLNGSRLEFNTIGDFMGAIESALGIVPENEDGATPVESSVEFGIPTAQ